MMNDAELIFEGSDELDLVVPQVKMVHSWDLLLRATNSEADSSIHDIEAFGSCSTIIGYKI